MKTRHPGNEAAAHFVTRGYTEHGVPPGYWLQVVAGDTHKFNDRLVAEMKVFHDQNAGCVWLEFFCFDPTWPRLLPDMPNQLVGFRAFGGRNVTLSTHDMDAINDLFDGFTNDVKLALMKDEAKSETA